MKTAWYVMIRALINFVAVDHSLVHNLRVALAGVGVMQHMFTFELL